VSGARTGTHEEGESHEDEAAARAPTEFDCPACNANNPCEALRDKDEVLCLFCGSSFEVRLSAGKVRLKEV